MVVKPRFERARAIAVELAQAVREVAAVPREASKHRPSPPTTGLVLEVGAGQAPHPRADLIVDKYVADNFERPAEAPLDVSRPLLVADGHHIPLADDSVAYVIALHVLEHATDPAQFARELSRVAHAGFIQVPSRESELIFGWPYHPWLIDHVDDTLIFEPRGEQKAPLDDFFHRSYAQSVLLRLWWAAHRSVWHHSVEWRGELRVEVKGKSTAPATAVLDLERTLAVLRGLADRGALQPLPAAVRDAIRCPVCRGRVAFADRRVDCRECGRVFPRVADVPVLLDEAVDAAT